MSSPTTESVTPPSALELPSLYRKLRELYTVENGELIVSLHPGQEEAYNALERIILVLAGSQGGKSEFGPVWLFREICDKGAGDYAIITPTYALGELKCIPCFRRFFEDTLRLGKYYQAPIRKFVFSKEGLMQCFGTDKKACTIFFGYAENPESLESSTYKAVWCDEAGQSKFKLDSWDALQRRLTIHKGRVLITTTPYEFGWLKTRIHDRSHCVPGGTDKDIKVVRFESTMNPAFSQEEFDRQKSMLPSWKFDMMFRAMWTKPAGSIFDCFDDKKNLIEPFPIPSHWIRVLGVDFGQVNTAGAFFALDPKSDNFYLYRTYHTGGKSAEQHTASLLSREPGVPIAFGGAPAEDDWRDKFTEAGLPIERPYIHDVEAGIDTMYQAIKTGRLKIFNHPKLENVIREVRGYARVLDSNGEPTDKIEDKHAYHRVDAMRYGCIEIMRGGFTGPQVVSSVLKEKPYGL